MHVLQMFFAWPDGSVYSNLLASAICAAIVWWRLQARIVAHHLEARLQAERHHAEHMAALSLDTPGGLAAVMSEVRDAKAAAEGAHGAVQALGAIKPAARRGTTEMRKTGGGKAGST